MDEYKEITRVYGLISTDVDSLLEKLEKELLDESKKRTVMEEILRERKKIKDFNRVDFLLKIIEKELLDDSTKKAVMEEMLREIKALKEINDKVTEDIQNIESMPTPKDVNTELPTAGGRAYGRTRRGKFKKIMTCKKRKKIGTRSKRTRRYRKHKRFV